MLARANQTSLSGASAFTTKSVYGDWCRGCMPLTKKAIPSLPCYPRLLCIMISGVRNCFQSFNDVVVHRMVDIGRCPRCQYIEWKCASVPLELRAVWQEALATHHQIQIAQRSVMLQTGQRQPAGSQRSDCMLRWIAAVGMSSFYHTYPLQIVRGLTSCWTT